MKKYIIVKTNRGFDTLEKYVNEAIENGYIPVGGPFRMDGDGASWWGQAMIYGPAFGRGMK